MSLDDINDLHSEPLDDVVPVDDVAEIQDHFKIYTNES